MKLLNNRTKLTGCLLLMIILSISAQETKPKLLVDVVYHQTNNQFPFVTVFTKAKIEKKFLPVANIGVKVYVGAESDVNLIGTVITNASGRAMLAFPVSVKPFWDTISQTKLIATTQANNSYAAVSNETTVTKAKIELDTVMTDGVRSVVAYVTAKNGNEWKPVKDVETKIVIKRSVGNLSVGDKETYTTDSSGKATAEFSKLAIPGDSAGNIILVAKTEENELYGSISSEMKVKWGSAFAGENTFHRRTLFATRDKAPVWLLLLAGSIFISVWSVIVYLILQIVKIRKAGLQYSSEL